MTPAFRSLARAWHRFRKGGTADCPQHSTGNQAAKEHESRICPAPATRGLLPLDQSGLETARTADGALPDLLDRQRLPMQRTNAANGGSMRDDFRQSFKPRLAGACSARCGLVPAELPSAPPRSPSSVFHQCL